jgi:hypothetical protein
MQSGSLDICCVSPWRAHSTRVILKCFRTFLKLLQCCDCFGSLNIANRNRLYNSDTPCILARNCSVRTSRDNAPCRRLVLHVRPRNSSSRCDSILICNGRIMCRCCTQCDVTTWPDTALSGPLNNPFGEGKGICAPVHSTGCWYRYIAVNSRY